jgi:hypothetical protein
MAWVAPEDDELYGSWSEDGEPSLPPPSQDATPQLTTKSGRTGTSPSSELAGSESKTKSSGTSKLADSPNSSTGYPDTGYPMLHQPGGSSVRGTGSPSRNLAGSSGDYDDSPSASGGPGLRAQPQRGFYGDSYREPSGGRYAETAAGAEDLPPGRYSDAEAGASRFSGSGSDYSRYGNPNDVAGSRAGTHEPLVSEPDQGYDPRGGQPRGDLSDSAGQVPYADDLTDPAKRPQTMADTTRQIADGVRDDYQRTGDELRGRLKEGASSISDSTRELTNNVQGLVREAGEQVERNATELTRGMRDGYSRYSNSAGEPGEGQDADDLASDATASGQPSESSIYSDPGAADGANAPYGASSQDPQQATRAIRSSQPWRPGSTGTYPAGDFDQTHLPAGGEQGDVEPASYPESVGAESRLAPAYR